MPSHTTHHLSNLNVKTKKKQRCFTIQHTYCTSIFLQLNLQSQYYRGWDVSGFTDFHDYSLTAYNVTTPTCCPRELPLHLDFTLTLTKPTTGWWTP